MSEKIHNTEGVLYACQPSYGSGDRDSHKQFWTQSINPYGPYAGMQSRWMNYGSSLLADAFNIHWTTALNLQLQGVPVTRFAMVHDDIVPESFYLDKLLEILDNTDADLVAAVCPIKDPRGLTSTAIDDPEDDWEVYRRLTMKEIHSFPETFCAADTPHPDKLLLANTGCWACRFDRPWRYQMFFEVRSKTVFVLKDRKIIPTTDYREDMVGTFNNMTMPEDWNFSRQLGRLGGKVYVTRAVKLDHRGSYNYPNYDATWGDWENDKSLVKKFDLKNGPPNVRGWMTENEGRLLAELAKGQAVLEIGWDVQLQWFWQWTPLTVGGLLIQKTH